MANGGDALPTWCFVCTADGEEAGQVQEVHGEYFHVGAGESDLWFRQDVSGEFVARRLALNLQSNEMDTCGVMPPPRHTRPGAGRGEYSRGR